MSSEMLLTTPENIPHLVKQLPALRTKSTPGAVKAFWRTVFLGVFWRCPKATNFSFQNKNYNIQDCITSFLSE
jgi:hypothetical protein